MHILLSVVFMLICWVVGILVLINFGIAAPQYGSKKNRMKYDILLTIALLVLFIGIPGFVFYIAL